MTASLAHELNNPLASVLGYGELLLERLEEEGGAVAAESSENLVRPILIEAERARHLVRSFLDFSRKADDELGPVHFGEAVDVVLALRKESYREAGLTVSAEGLQDVWVLAERQMLQGVVLKLVNNALDAMRPNGEGTLRIRSLRPKHPDGHVAVDFEDDGPGMTHPHRVSEPFFTTKPVGAGTGLGHLVVCDVKMPGESGLDFYRWLRDTHRGLAEPRFLFVTGDVSGAELQRLAEERPELLVHKPFNVREYLGRVSALIA